MRRFFLALILLLGVVFVITHFAEVEAIGKVIGGGDWRFLAVALGVEAAWLVNVTASYRAIYRALGVEESILPLLPLAAAANFANVVAPTVGMSGIAVFISEARRRNYSPGNATVAATLFVLFDYAGFLCFLAVGLAVLFRRNDLNMTEIIATGLLVLIAAVLATLLYLGTRSAEALENALAWGARLVNRILWPFVKRPYLSVGRAHEFAREAAGGLEEVRNKPQNLLMPFALALSSKALLLSIFFFTFLAFKVPLSVGTLIAGFSVAYLFHIVSPTPAGVGVVEGLLTLALRSMYVPLGAAAVITLTYRGITFWVPMLVGMLSFRWLARPQEIAVGRRTHEGAAGIDRPAGKE